jgi:hypothetical protein
MVKTFLSTTCKVNLRQFIQPEFTGISHSGIAACLNFEEILTMC